MNKKTLKILIVGGVVILFLAGAFLLHSLLQSNVLKNELVDENPYFADSNEYNLSVDAELELKESPLYTCNANTIPEYLDQLASEIDEGLQKTTDAYFVRWEKDNTEVLRYDIDTTVFRINLTKYPEAIRFSTIEEFMSTYLDASIKYTTPIINEGKTFKMYRVNRIIDGKEIKVGLGSSDYFYTINGYLSTARVLLAQIEKSQYVVPMIDDPQLLESYLSNSQYPKNIIVDTSSVIKTKEYDYQVLDVQFEYENCVTNNLEPILLFSNCNQNYIYYSYEISGVCDIEYEKQLFSVPFKGFINAIEPEYVKNIE